MSRMERFQRRPQSAKTEVLEEEDLGIECDAFTAASIGDVMLVQEHLRNGFYPDVVNSSGWTPLMYAAYLSHAEVCSLLLQHGASVNVAAPDGRTALMLASACNCIAVVELLLQSGAEVNHQDEAGDTALSIAASLTHVESVKLLLEAGADPNKRSASGMTPTLTACSTRHELTLLAILERGGLAYNRNVKGENGEDLAASDPKIIAMLRNPPPVIARTSEENGRTRAQSVKREQYRNMLDELQRVQNEIEVKHAELQKASMKHQQMQQTVHMLMNAVGRSRESAMSVLQEMRRLKGFPFELQNDMRTVEMQLREISMKILDLGPISRPRGFW